MKSTKSQQELIVPNEKSKVTIFTVMLEIFKLIPIVVSIWTIYHTTNAWKEDRMSKRAYFAVSRNKDLNQFDVAETKYNENNVIIRFNFVFENLGKNPATEFNVYFYFINKRTFELGEAQSVYFGNDFAPDFKWDPEIKIKLPLNFDPTFFIIKLKYVDPVLNIPFDQNFFFPWQGIKDGIPYGKIEPLTKNEELKLLEILKKYPKER